jgi:apurinic endonuclease APN1
MKFGAHISSRAPFGETPLRAKEADCDCMQIFANPPQRWNPALIPDEQIKKFIENNKRAQIEPIIIHSIYLINLASNNPFFYQASQKSLIDDMQKARAIGALGVNTHLGSTKDRSLDECLNQIVKAIRNILEAVPEGPDFIIENSAGAGNIIGDELEEIGAIVKAVKSKRVKVLIDTAHAFASGYHIETKQGLEEFLDKFESLIGLDKLVGFHFNDSKTAFNSKKDRHEDIGQGEIGKQAFQNIVTHPKLEDLFAILETPAEKLSWDEQLKLLRSF